MNRKTARENAFILLFELSCKSDETAEEIFEKATSVRELECDDFVKRVFFGANENMKIFSPKVYLRTGWTFLILFLDKPLLLRYHNIVHKLPFSGFVKRGLGPAQ